MLVDHGDGRSCGRRPLQSQEHLATKEQHRVAKLALTTRKFARSCATSSVKRASEIFTGRISALEPLTWRGYPTTTQARPQEGCYLVASRNTWQQQTSTSATHTSSARTQLTFCKINLANRDTSVPRRGRARRLSPSLSIKVFWIT